MARGYIASKMQEIKHRLQTKNELSISVSSTRSQLRAALEQRKHTLNPVSKLIESGHAIKKPVTFRDIISVASKFEHVIEVACGELVVKGRGKNRKEARLKAVKNMVKIVEEPKEAADETPKELSVKNNKESGHVEPHEEFLDDTSKLGRFGWCELGGVYLPTIFRLKSSFFSVKIVENHLLSKFLELLPREVLTCARIASYRVTVVEARLLNEINIKHVDFLFGKSVFSTMDQIVKVDDVIQLYRFLGLCRERLLFRESGSNFKFGFKRIGGLSEVPYVKVEGKTCLPLFYFDGEIGQVTVTLRGMDSACLKFCCKVQGVKDELIVGDFYEALALEELRDYYPPGTTFVDYWPAKDHINKVGSSKKSELGSWTRISTFSGSEKFSGRLETIKEFSVKEQTLGDLPPYETNEALILRKEVPCINIRPFEFTEVMFTLPHLVEELFPGFTEKQVGDMLVVMGVTMFQGNNGHVKVIKQEGWGKEYDQVPLVTLRDVLVNFEDLKTAVKRGELPREKRYVGN